MLDLEKFAFKEGRTPLSAEELNGRFYALVRRLHVLELLRVDWQAAVSEVRNHGLQRINDAIGPLLDGLRNDLTGLIEAGNTQLAEQEGRFLEHLDGFDARVAVAEAAFDVARAAIDGFFADLAGSLSERIDVAGGLEKDIRDGKLLLSAPPAAAATLISQATLFGAF